MLAHRFSVLNHAFDMLINYCKLWQLSENDLIGSMLLCLVIIAPVSIEFWLEILSLLLS